MHTSKVIVQSSDGEYCCTFDVDLSRREARELSRKLNSCFTEMQLRGYMAQGVVATVETPL